MWSRFIFEFISSEVCESNKKLCILRASREEYQRVWVAITMARSIGSCPVVFNLLDLSGSIKACRTAALRSDELKFQQIPVVGRSSPYTRASAARSKFSNMNHDNLLFFKYEFVL